MSLHLAAGQPWFRVFVWGWAVGTLFMDACFILPVARQALTES